MDETHPIMQRARAQAMSELQGLLPLIPAHMHDPLINYVAYGDLPGQFLQSLLANDLVQTLRRADPENRQMIDGWLDVLAGGIPCPCWGSYDAVNNWCARGGCVGIADPRQYERKESP